MVFVEMDSWGDISCVRWPTWGANRLKETERGKQASDGWGGKSPWEGDTGLQRLEVFQSLIKHLPFLTQNICQESPFSPWRGLANRIGYSKTKKEENQSR